VAAVGWTALRSYGLGAAWYSILMLPTSVAMIGFSRAASPDMLFAVLLTAAMAVASEMLQKPRPGPILGVAFGFFLGAAVLAKGPAAVILAGGATLLWAALSRKWRAPFRFLHPLIIVVFCATALPWYVLCAMRNPDFLRIFIWQHNFERYLTPIFEHRQPFWFFGPIFLLGILPWLPLLVTSFFDLAGNDRWATRMNSPALFLACWSLFTLLFFSLSQSKLPGYILPAIPPATLLVARSFVRRTEQKMRGMRSALACVGIVFPILVGIVAVKLGPFFGPGEGFLSQSPFAGVRLGMVVALVGGVLTAAFAAARKCNGAVCISAWTILIFLLIANRMVMPGIDALASVRPAAAALSRDYKVKPDEIAVYQLPRAYEYGLDYYFEKQLPELTSENTSASIIVFGVNSDIYGFPSMRPGGTFDSNPASLDGKILWAWKKDRPNRPTSFLA